jgi:hypothetical protein
VAPRKKKWWRTVPAIIAGITTFLSAITGLLIALDKLGAISSGEKILSPDAWLSSADYQKLFEDQVRKGFYPIKVQGRLNNKRQEFRGEWHSGQGPCSWRSHGELSSGQFKKIDAEYTADGYTLSWKSEFASEFGSAVIQAIWIQPCE